MKHFKIEEFDCKCGCGKNFMKGLFLDMIDSARDIAGVPFNITSGFRCKKHNKAVGGKKTSSHMKGMASDIECVNSSDRWAIEDGLFAAGFLRIGEGDTFVHADNDPYKDQNVKWRY